MSESYIRGNIIPVDIRIKNISALHYNSYSCNIVSTIPLLEKHCTEAQKSFLNRSAIYCRYGKDHFIFNEKFPAHYIFFVLSGTIALWKEDIYGRKYIIRFAKVGDLFGFCGGFTEKHTYRFSASAIQNSTICSIEKDVFATVLEENHELNSNILLSYAKELEKSGSLFHALANMNAKEKVAESLLIIQDTFKNKENGTPLTISFSRQDMADITGTSRGNVIKQLSELRAKKIIATCGSKISFLRPDKLSEIVARFHK